LIPRTMLDHALDAVRHGFTVIPIKPGKKFPPILTGGISVSGSRDEAQVRKWWSQYPDANIACNAGVLVDVDEGINNVTEAQNIAKLWGLPPTFTVHTGGRPEFGVHFHFTGTAPNQGPFVANGCRGEIRNLAGNYYGMAPGSIHPDSGERYEVLCDLPIAEYPQACRLAPARSKNEQYGPMTVEEIRSKMTYLFREAAYAAQGNRNDSAHRATYFAARGFAAGAFEQSEDEIKRSILSAVNANYRPGERDVRKMLRDSWNRGLSHGPFEITDSDEWIVDEKGYMKLKGEVR
jgi:Bifunctional DNA primase/polymerase, N-terminal